MSREPVWTRRSFLKTAAAVAAAPTIIPARALGLGESVAPSERIAIGFLGLGGQGRANMHAFIRNQDAQVVALCEVDQDNLKRAVSDVKNRLGDGFQCQVTKDFREVIDRADVDAVMISTPDHWHVPMSVLAAQAGKDVICEKPTLTVAEGRVLCEAVQRYGIVYQTSTEDRSVPQYLRMAELVRNGRLGKLHAIHVGLPAGPGSPGDPTPAPVPAGLDWDLWLGPAPWAPYCPARVHFNFRWISDYSGGMLTDWGMHLLDTAQWGNDTEHTGPIEVEGVGKYHAGGLYDTAHQFELTYKYANGVTLTVKSTGPSIRFEGSDGWVGNKGWRAPVEASSQKILDSVIGPEETHLYTCPQGEHRNFLDCVKSRQDPYFPAEIGQRCNTICHIGNIAMQLRRKLRWAPDREQFLGDETANRLLSRAYREPWKL
ncbi:MAG: Gfo/Idh/MocA family oxidoreductase [Candidatus Anammoximicrobium sp.]|nr:Gfo/Idh/MocA family oxidoreductase [Candidatus Anammoximicrobium sp.]